MINSLGCEIYNNCKKTPYGGILVFFPSYFYLNKCQTNWNDSGIFHKIGQYKKIYVDSSKEKSLVGDIKKSLNKNYIFFLFLEVILQKELIFLMIVQEW